MSDVTIPKDRVADGPRVADADLGRARLENLLGLVTPVANLGMRHTAARELRWFGVGAGVVLLAATWVLGRQGRLELAGAAAAAHAALVLAGLVNPRFPEAAGRLWLRFGETLGRWMAVPIFALLYFLAVTPTALLVRLLGKDPLRRSAPRAESYWVKRHPAPPERFERQF